MNKVENIKPIKVGVLGFGGLGQAAARVLSLKREMIHVATADLHGYLYQPEGIDTELAIKTHHEKGSIGHLGRLCANSIQNLIEQADVDGYFLALPNLPNNFMAEVVDLFQQMGWRGVLVDALKRTSALEMMLLKQTSLQQSGITYLTGCGATPGLLTAAAAIAAQSYHEVHQVEITFGVGIANWEAYRSTIREDIGHLAEYNIEQARSMSDEEVEALLEARGGILKLENMEHADDLMLERLGICSRDQVKVGGVVDTRNAKKPLSTNVKVTGRTFEGKISTHTFILGDETSMAANVCGPAFGYLKSGYALNQRQVYGIYTAAEIMPQFVR
jgi:hypothetical protein